MPKPKPIDITRAKPKPVKLEHVPSDQTSAGPLGFDEHTVTAFFPNGEKVTITRKFFRRCFVRAIELQAEKVIDSANHVWIRKEKEFHSAGVI